MPVFVNVKESVELVIELATMLVPLTLTTPLPVVSNVKSLLDTTLLIVLLAKLTLSTNITLSFKAVVLIVATTVPLVPNLIMLSLAPAVSSGVI